MSLEPAARLKDGIGHTHKKAVTAVLTPVVIAVGVGVAVFTGGAGLALIAAIAAGAGSGASLGTWLSDTVGSYLPRVPAGHIASSAERTFIEDKLAARIEDELECADPFIGPIMMPGEAGRNLDVIIKLFFSSEHTGAKIAEGSDSVYVEGKNSARLTDGTSCGGKITSAAKRTNIGGDTVVLAGYEKTYEEGPVLSWTFFLIEKIGGLVGGVIGTLAGVGFDIAGAAFGLASWMFEQAGYNTVAGVFDSLAAGAAAFGDFFKNAKLTRGGVPGVVTGILEAAKKFSAPEDKRKVVSYPK